MSLISLNEGAAAPIAAAHEHLRAGRPLEALRAADRAIALEGRARGWFAFGLGLDAIGEGALAIAAFSRAVAIEPDFAPAHAGLGRLRDDADQPSLAERDWLRALELNPNDVASRVDLSSLYCRADQFELGAEHARLAIARDPGHRGAHQNLANIYAKQGRDDDAARHRDLAHRGRALVASGHPGGRRVLTLASAAWGNTPDRYLIPAERYQRLIWFIAYVEDAELAAPPPHDVVFNAIGDPDAAAAAARVGQLATDARILNPPSVIARTARHLARDLFAGIADLEIPVTIRLSARESTPTGVAEALDRADLTAPFLIRPLGSHGGEGLRRIARRDDAKAISEALAPGREHYLSSFHDFCGADQLYRKYRVFFVDRRPFPYHLAIGPDWLVHYVTSGTASHPERLAEERRFLADPEAALGARAMVALRAIGDRMDLDFTGADFSLLPDGRLLLFEANATMLVHPEATDGPLAHKNPYVADILAAFATLLDRDAAR